MYFKVWFVLTLQFLPGKTACTSCDCDLVTGPNGVVDNSITASSYYNGGNCLPKYVRLNVSDPKSWCPATSSNQEYLQIEFLQVSWLKAFITRGRGNGQYMETYHLKISRDGATWDYVTTTSGSIKIFPANDDTSSMVKHIVGQMIITKFIRIYPQTWTGFPSFKLEIEGCPYKPYSCWKAVLGSQGETLPIVHQDMTSNNGFCGRACHRHSTCESFLFNVSSNGCQLLANITLSSPLAIYADLSMKFYFVKDGSCFHSHNNTQG